MGRVSFPTFPPFSLSPSSIMVSAGRLFSKTPLFRWLWLPPKTAKPPLHRFAFSTATKKQVGTHNGSFHCDEALACFLLRLTTKFSGADIVRTRDLQVPPNPKRALHSFISFVWFPRKNARKSLRFSFVDWNFWRR